VLVVLHIIRDGQQGHPLQGGDAMCQHGNGTSPTGGEIRLLHSNADR